MRPQSPFVRGLERVRDLGADPCRPFGRQRTLAFEERPEVGSLDESHRKVELTVCLPGPVDRNDVGVLGGGGGVGLVDEPITEGGI